jgi:release factor glutamine methyltransferase
LAVERLTGRPLWYVLGSCDFYGYEVKVDERALIPRPETEELVDLAIKEVDGSSAVLDLCTGSGAIALVINKKTGATVTASDISEDALSLARENFKKHGVEIITVKSDIFENIGGKFDLIVSNPPYIKSTDIDGLQKEVKDFEPVLALDGGEDGLNFYRIIAREAKSRLVPNGKLLLEVGIGQAEDVKALLEVDYHVEIIKDLSGIERIIKAELI